MYNVLVSVWWWAGVFMGLEVNGSCRCQLFVLISWFIWGTPIFLPEEVVESYSTLTVKGVCWKGAINLPRSCRRWCGDFIATNEMWQAMSPNRILKNSKIFTLDISGLSTFLALVYNDDIGSAHFTITAVYLLESPWTHYSGY